MDYKKKYIKYKIKYLNKLKQLKGGEIHNYIYKLKTLYPSCKHDNGLQEEYKSYKITYGEMEYEGFDMLYDYLNNQYEINNFIDIGSGRGKICLYAISKDKINSAVGIEIVTERYEDAIKLKSNLSEYKFSEQVQFINGCFNDYDFREHNNTLIWISNLCFNQETTNAIFNKIISEIGKNSIIACSKKHDFEHNNIVFIENLSVKMSWSSNSNIFIYKIVK
jgi:hypothetical protein